jgi:hypothetical protein
MGLWWARKHVNEEPDPKKKTVRENDISYSKAMFEVGETKVKLTFEDGKHFLKTIRGHVYQYVNPGNDASTYGGFSLEEPKVGETFVTNSLFAAQQFLQGFHAVAGELGYTDNDFAPTETRIGKVINAKILKSSSCEIEFLVAKVVPKESK